MLFGDRLQRPWYRTIFTNIADVVSPEMLPPLQLESSPVDVGELLGDEIAHPWWQSLLGNLRDRLSPERLPALELTSEPVKAYEADTWLQILDWSSLLDTPKVYLPDAPRPAMSYAVAGADGGGRFRGTGLRSRSIAGADAVQARYFALPLAAENLDLAGGGTDRVYGFRGDKVRVSCQVSAFRFGYALSYWLLAISHLFRILIEK